MIKYPSYRFIFPPRPSNAVSSANLGKYDNGKYMAQPKLDGDCMLVFTNGKETIIMNRHKKPFSKTIRMYPTLCKLHREPIAPMDIPKGRWMILVGEYMVKSKKNAEGKVWNDKFVIVDIIAFDGVQLIGKTFQERQDLLDQLYGKEDIALLADGSGTYHDKFLYATNIPDVFRVKSYYNCFDKLWKDLTKIQMFEGLVLKRCNAKLENGLSEKNNSASMVKFRRSTKNYRH